MKINGSGKVKTIIAIGAVLALAIAAFVVGGLIAGWDIAGWFTSQSAMFVYIIVGAYVLIAAWVLIMDRIKNG